MRIFSSLLFAALVLLLFVVPLDARRRPNDSQPPTPSAAIPPGLPSPQETARFLAGMPVDPNSPLAPLTRTPAWQEHSAYFEKAFAKLTFGKFARLRAWQDNFLPESRDPIPVVYYMFSGPDFLYPDQFFPNASVYIMCGKESMGVPPDPLQVADLPGALQNLENAMKSSLTATYFITQDMKVDLQQQNLSGTLPILYVFLARANKTIKDVTFISLDRGGGIHESAAGRGGTPGVRISYYDNTTGHEQTLFYFTTDISDGGIGSNPGFMSFCEQHGVGVSFLKSSSYLMFENGFDRVRNFILNHSNLIVQDDSGIPLAYFNRDKWNLRLFGTYVGPIELFRKYDQPKLHELFQEVGPPEFGIGFGYQWDSHKSNLIVASRAPAQASSR